MDRILIENCFFSILTSSSNGGAILIERTTLYLLMENLMFYSCHVTNTYHGGAIYIRCLTEGGIVLNKVCGNSCFTLIQSNYQFGYIYINSNKFINISFLSISKSPNNSNYLRSNVIVVENGKQYIKNLNSSLNEVLYHSGFYSYVPNNLKGTYFTFSNNKCVSNGNIVLWLYQGINRRLYNFQKFRFQLFHK